MVEKCCQGLAKRTWNPWRGVARLLLFWAVTGFCPNVPQDVSKEARAEIVKFRDGGALWEMPQQVCTTMCFPIPKNVTSERSMALLPTFDSVVSGGMPLMGATEVGSAQLGRRGSKWKGPISEK